MLDVRYLISLVDTAVSYLVFVRATPLMIVTWLIFIALGLITYAAFLKLAARLLRYSVSWRSVAIRMGHGARSHHLGWLVFQWARHKPPRCSPWLVRRHTAHSAGVCNDDCGSLRNRYSGPGFSQQTPFAVPVINR